MANAGSSSRLRASLTRLILFSYVWISAFLLKSCFGLYEDQVGKFDWRQQNIGAVISAHFDNSPGSRRIVVSSEQNVLAAINPRTWQLAWRQVLESGEPGTIRALAVGSEIISVSGSESHIRGWDLVTGHLNWESNPVASNSDGAIVHFYHINLKDETVLVIDGFDSFVQVKSYNYRTAELISSKRIAAPWFSKHTHCAFISRGFFVCMDSPSSTVYSLSLSNGTAFLQIALPALGITSINSNLKLATIIDDNANGNHLFAIKIGPTHWMLLKATHDGIILIKKAEDVSTLSAFQVNDDTLVFILKKRDDGTYLLKVYNLTSDSYVEDLQGDISFPAHHGEPDKVFSYVILKKEGGYGYRLLIHTTAHSLLLLQNPGKLVWVREESLASVLTVEMVDLPVSESEAQMEEQFGMANNNILMLFYKRLTTQLLHLQSFLTHVLSSIHDEATGMISNTESDTVLIRDDFNIHKVVILVTSVGKIFCIDNLTGKIIWQNFIPNMEPFDRYGKPNLLLFIQRTSTHYPRSPQCAVLGRNKHSKNGMLYVFNPITGEPLDGNNGIVPLDYQVFQASQLPFPNAEFLRGLLLVDNQYKVHIYPDSVLDITLQNAKELYIFTANADTGELQGLNLAVSASQQLIAEKTWSLIFPTASQTITNAVMKRAIEHVHSQGRVMGDRSVLYKYLNPNLAVITTECYHPTQKSSLNVYLVDVVSGTIVFSSSHKKAKGPIHVVHSENWIMYTYFNEKHRRVEVAVLELYEGKTQSNTTAFSSLTLPPSPMIERQAYIFPYFIDAVTVTITEKGITNKHLLYALPFGGIVELPKAFLDPRRSLFPTQEHREEGIFPYNPELPVVPENRINYYQSVYRIRDIYTVPTGLESTCLVFAYGLDLFFTRVTPSRTFDVLKEDFDHWLIVAVLLGLIGTSYLTKKLAAKKALKQAWK